MFLNLIKSIVIAMSGGNLIQYGKNYLTIYELVGYPVA